jgi:hypothetical protein
MPGITPDPLTSLMTGLQNSETQLEHGRLSSSPLRDHCMESFFVYFQAAHPFLLPKTFLLERLRTRPLPHLEAAMRYVGSYFVKSAPIAAIEEEVRLALSRNFVKDGFTVQALLLFAIAMDGSNAQPAALELLIQAQDLALELGMNRREYASIHGEGSPVLEESWRRTWWELYIIDGMIAGVHQASTFRLNTVPANVYLPCEEQEYTSGVSQT